MTASNTAWLRHAAARVRLEPAVCPPFTPAQERGTPSRLTPPGTLLSSLAIAIIVAGLIALGGFIGLFLQRRLAAWHTSERSRDMIGGVVGLLTLLLAVNLALLIWTAYGVYSTQQTELQTIAARALEFDLEMRQYGPEGDRGRELLRRDLVWAHEQFWGEDASRAEAYEASYKAMGDLNAFFDSLEPKPERRRSCSPRRAPTTPSSASSAFSCRCRRRRRSPGRSSMR